LPMNIPAAITNERRIIVAASDVFSGRNKSNKLSIESFSPNCGDLPLSGCKISNYLRYKSYA